VSSFDKEILVWLEHCTFPVLERFSLHIKQKANAVLIFAALLTACHESKTFQHVTHVRLCLSDDQSAFSLGGYLSAILPQLFPNLKCFDCFGDSTDNIVPMAEEIVGNFVKDKFGIGDGENRQDDSAEEEKKDNEEDDDGNGSIEEDDDEGDKDKDEVDDVADNETDENEHQEAQPDGDGDGHAEKDEPESESDDCEKQENVSHGAGYENDKGVQQGEEESQEKDCYAVTAAINVALPEGDGIEMRRPTHDKKPSKNWHWLHFLFRLLNGKVVLVAKMATVY
jgi:hypothetical protein